MEKEFEITEKTRVLLLSDYLNILGNLSTLENGYASDLLEPVFGDDDRYSYGFDGTNFLNNFSGSDLSCLLCDVDAYYTDGQTLNSPDFTANRIYDYLLLQIFADQSKPLGQYLSSISAVGALEWAKIITLIQNEIAENKENEGAKNEK